MFEAFSHSRLNLILETHPVSAQGKEFIYKALNEPSRNVQGTTKNVVGEIPCPKMGWTSQTESWSNEDPFTLKHIFDNLTIGYVNQVPTIAICYKGRNGKTIRTPYTGDCLRFDESDGVIVEEYKPSTDRHSLDDKYPGKYSQLSDGTYTSLAISDVLAPMGIKFKLRFSDEISLTSHRNRRLLYTYLQPKAASLYERSHKDLLKHFKAQSGYTLSSLLESGANLDCLFWALAHGRLHVDLDAHLLATESEKTYVFRSQESMKAWALAIRPDGSRPASDREFEEYEFCPGDQLIVDGQQLTITLAGATCLHAMSQKNEHISIDYELLNNAHRSGKVSFLNLKKTSSKDNSFWKSSPYAIEKAINSLEIIRSVDEKTVTEDELKISYRTIRRYKSRIQKGQALGLSPVESLIDKSHLRGFRGPHIDAHLSEKINTLIIQALGDKLNKSKIAIYFDVQKIVESAGHQMISKSSFYTRVNSLQTLKTIRKSAGHKNAYQLSPAFWMLEMSTPVHCERALELVHFDSTLLDIELRSSISGEVLGRPWLSIAICAHSRRVVGLHLSFAPPSHLSSMMLLADLVKRTGRIPDAIIHDWGSEFKAKDFKTALSALFIKRYVRAKSSPKFGAILERIFGIVTSELIANIAGNTKLRKNVRQLSRSVDPTTHSGLWLADLYEGLEQYFFSIYNTKKHSTTLRTPQELFDATLITFGYRPHRMHRFEDIMPILMPFAGGRPRTVDPSRGLFVNYRYYGHPQLMDLALKGSSVLVKTIPFDPGSILAFHKNQWIICKAGIHEDLRSTPELFRRCLFEEWSLEKRLVAKAGNSSRKRLRSLMDDLNHRAITNKAYFDLKNVKNLFSDDFIDEDSEDEINNSSLASLNHMMSDVVEQVMSDPSVGKLLEA